MHTLQHYFEHCITDKYFGKFPEPTLLNKIKSDLQNKFTEFNFIELKFDHKTQYFTLNYCLGNEGYVIRCKAPLFSIP